MSWTINPGYMPDWSQMSKDGFRVAMSKTDFTLKNSSGSSIAYFLNGNSITMPPILRVAITPVRNIYEKTAISAINRLPDVSGKLVTVSLYHYARAICSNDDCKMAFVPQMVSKSFIVPNFQLFDRADEYDDLYAVLFAILDGSIPATDIAYTEAGAKAKAPKYSLLAMGVKDIVAALE
jgi:hypothetical protein